MIVKICGITNREDALAAAEAGATALGFNFYSKSPRYVRPGDAAHIMEALPASVWKAGVFVNEPRREVEELARQLGLDIAQLHGDETPESYPSGVRVWKAVCTGPGVSISDWDECPAEALLIDGPAEALYGGAGKTFDWRLAAGGAKRIVLAGGLDASNVQQAIAAARPWGVDACSRIESSPGRKDHARMAEFIRAALTSPC